MPRMQWNDKINLLYEREHCLFWGGLPPYKQAATTITRRILCPQRSPGHGMPNRGVVCFRCVKQPIDAMRFDAQWLYINLTTSIRYHLLVLWPDDYKSKEYLIYFPRIPSYTIGMQIGRVQKESESTVFGGRSLDIPQFGGCVGRNAHASSTNVCFKVFVWICAYLPRVLRRDTKWIGIFNLQV